MKKEMVFKIFMFILMIVIIKSARERDIKSLLDKEYDILIRKIKGEYDVSVADRSAIEKAVLRR